MTSCGINELEKLKTIPTRQIAETLLKQTGKWKA